MNMKKTYIMQMALAGLFLLSGAACTPDAEDYDPAGLVDGVGAYFSPEATTSYKLEGPTGSITLDVMRSNDAEAADAALTATFSEGGEGVFDVPSTVSFAAGESASTLTIDYDNLVQGTTYTITLDLAGGTPYANSSLALTISWPNEVVYTWKVVSENAILTESLFSLIGMQNIQTTGIVVEKANEGEVYRFRCPFNNAYFYDAFGGDVFEDDSDMPYIIVDGETYKDASGKPMFYIAPTALGFTFSLTPDGQYVNIDTDDKETQTFGSVAGNLKTDAGPIEPGDPTYPLGSYDESKKVLDLGCVYLDVANYQIMVNKAGSMTLALDPSLLAPDYDRDYTWHAVPEATGFFTSELTGESWMQAVEQSEEDETFYRMPNLYSPAEKAHIYFNIDMETGVVTVPEGQNTGMTTFGNSVYLKGTANASSFDPETGTLTLGFTFYLADEEGNVIADLQETTETFLWGQSEFDQLQKGTDIADYVGNWIVSLTDGSDGGQVLASITQKDATTLAVQGLTAGMMGDYDDTMLLSYDEETGWVRFDLQEAASFQGYSVLVASYNSETGEFSEEGLIGGLDKAGNLKFLNDESNQGKYDAMVYLATDGQSMMYLTGYWNNLVWAPYSADAQQASFNRTSALSFQKVEQGFVPRRTYKTELNIQPKPVTKKMSATKRASFDSSLVGGTGTTFSLTR